MKRALRSTSCNYIVRSTSKNLKPIVSHKLPRVALFVAIVLILWSLSTAAKQDLVLGCWGVEVLVLTPAPQHALTSTQNLVGYWNFDNKRANDSSRIGNNGTIKGTAEFGTSPNKTHALILNGINTAVEVPNHPSLNMTDELTIEAWIKPGVNLPNGKTYVLVSKFSDVGGYKLVWYGKKAYFYLYVTDGIAVKSNGVRLNAGQWYYLAVAYKSGTKGGKIYLNQKDITFEVTPRIMTASSASLFLGVEANNEGSPFKGAVDEVRIYNMIHSPDNPLPISALVFSRDPGLVIGLILLFLAMATMAVSYFVPSLGKRCNLRGLVILIFSCAIVTPLFLNIDGITLLSLGKSLLTRHSPGQTLPASLFILCLIVLLWAIGLLSKRSHFKRTSFDILMLLFFLMNGIALAVGLIHSFSSANLLFFFQAMAPLLSFYVAVNLFNEVRQIKWAIYAMIAVATIVAAPLLLQILLAIRTGYPRADVMAMVDRLWRFNIYQMYGYFPIALVTIAAIALALYLKDSHTMKRDLVGCTYLLSSIAVLSLLVLLLNSRAAILMLIGVIGIEVLLKRFPRKAWILLLLAAVAALVLFLILPRAVILPQWADLLKFHGSRGISNRLANWAEALRIIAAHPLWGKGYAASLMTEVGPKVIRSHNQYLELGVKSGLGSLLLFLLLMGLALGRSYLLYKSASDSFSKAIGLGVFSWLITMILIGNMVQGPFIQTFTALLSWFLIGAVEALHLKQYGP